MSASKARTITPLSGVIQVLTQITSDSGSQTVESWGFFRPIEETDRVSPYWFAYRNKAICWLEQTPFLNVWCPHFAVNPALRSRPFSIRQGWKELQEVAYHISGKQPGLLTVVGDESNLFKRLGFEWDPGLCIYLKTFGVFPWENTLELRLEPFSPLSHP